MILNMTENPVAIVRPADRVPGLFDVQVTTGEAFYDLTIAQLYYLAAKHGWTVMPAEEGPYWCRHCAKHCSGPICPTCQREADIA